MCFSPLQLSFQYRFKHNLCASCIVNCQFRPSFLIRSHMKWGTCMCFIFQPPDPLDLPESLCWTLITDHCALLLQIDLLFKVTEVKLYTFVSNEYLNKCAYTFPDIFKHQAWALYRQASMSKDSLQPSDHQQQHSQWVGSKRVGAGRGWLPLQTKYGEILGKFQPR